MAIVRLSGLSAVFGLFACVALGQEMTDGPYANEWAYISALAEVSQTVSGTDTVGVIRSVELVVEDQVDGGCWTNSSAVAARMRVELEKFGIAVYEEPLALRTVFAPLLQINGLGYRTGSGVCVASASMEIVYWGTTRLGDIANVGRAFEFENPVLIWSASSVFSNSARIDDQFLSQAQEWADRLIGDISKARRVGAVAAVLETWPNPTPMTAVEFEEFIEGLAN